jgi:hypothetical protein
VVSDGNGGDDNDGGGDDDEVDDDDDNQLPFTLRNYFLKKSLTTRKVLSESHNPCMLHDLLTSSNLKAVSAFFSSFCLHLHLSTAFWTFLIFTVRFPQVILPLIQALINILLFHSLRKSVTFFDKGKTATPIEA